MGFCIILAIGLYIPILLYRRDLQVSIANQTPNERLSWAMRLSEEKAGIHVY